MWTFIIIPTKRYILLIWLQKSKSSWEWHSGEAKAIMCFPYIDRDWFWLLILENFMYRTSSTSTQHLMEAMISRVFLPGTRNIATSRSVFIQQSINGPHKILRFIRLLSDLHFWNTRLLSTCPEKPATEEQADRYQHWQHSYYSSANGSAILLCHPHLDYSYWPSAAGKLLQRPT